MKNGSQFCIHRVERKSDFIVLEKHFTSPLDEVSPYNIECLCLCNLFVIFKEFRIDKAHNTLRT